MSVARTWRSASRCAACLRRSGARRPKTRCEWCSSTALPTADPGTVGRTRTARHAGTRALITQPRVLLLDEPLSALDESLRTEMRGLVRQPQRRLAITTIFVTHDQREACEVGDQVAILLDRRIAQPAAARLLHRSCQRSRRAIFRMVRRRIAQPAERGAVVAFHPSVARLCSDFPTTEQADSFPVVIEHVTDSGPNCVWQFDSHRPRLDLVQSSAMTTAAVAAGAPARLVVPQSALRTFPPAYIVLAGSHHDIFGGSECVV